jgi:acetylornithine deacetylase/succinyl-diaminopimelate desuccinylase-like protein
LIALQRSDVVILVTGDADFVYLATKLHRHGIRVDIASVASNLGHILRSAANHVIDLTAPFRTLGTETLLIGLGLPDCRMHSPNENFPLENLEAGIRLNQVLLRYFAE